MLKRKEYHICDRCKKEIDKINSAFDFQYCYELCDDCMDKFKEYDKKRSSLEKAIIKLAKKYQFNKYLPKEDGNNE